MTLEEWEQQATRGTRNLFGQPTISESAQSGFNSHDRIEGREEWLTPPEIIKALGDFDLDPCAPTPETRPWETAKEHFCIHDNGLTKPWTGKRVWLNHVCSCGVEPVVINFPHDETMSKMQTNPSSNGEGICQTSREGNQVANVVVSGLPSGTLPPKTSPATERPKAEKKTSGGKEAIQPERKGDASEAAVVSYAQPSAPPKTLESSVEMDAAGLEKMQDGLEQSMRVLRCKNGTDARPFHSTHRSELPRHNSKQHDSSLLKMQHEQTETPSDDLVQGQDSRCPNCGKTGKSYLKSLRVFLNPPYGAETGKWMARAAEHGNVTALIFARTETIQFFESIWPKAKAVCFLKGRLSFYHVSGKRGGTAGAPSMLVTWDDDNANILRQAVMDGKIKGAYIDLRGGRTAP